MKLLKSIQLQCGQTYLAQTDDGYLLEIGDVFMSREKALGTRPYRFSDFQNPSDTNKRVMTICTLAGCPMHCTFCASRKSYKRKLKTEEIIDQVDCMLHWGLKFGRDGDPNNAKEFRILYTRMGEPMLNVESVVDSIRVFIKRYPHVNIGMSTSGIKTGLEQFMQHKDILPHIDMQFSLHSTSDIERSYLFDLPTGKTILSIPEIAKYSKLWYSLTGKPVCLNVILFKGYTYDFLYLRKFFNPEHIWLRLSPWNEIFGTEQFEGIMTEKDVIAKKPLSNNLKKIIKNIEQAGFAYAYAPAIDEEIKHHVACGQALQAFSLHA